MTVPHLQTIYRFPFKGFAGETLQSAKVETGGSIPQDRRYAVTNGTTYEGEWMRSHSFFVNAYNDGMYLFKMDCDENGVRISNTNGVELSFRHGDAESLEKANRVVPTLMQTSGPLSDGPAPKIVEASDKVGGIWDYVDTPISIISAATVRAIGEQIGAALAPDRFRGNLIVDGLEPWKELSWMGKRIRIGDVTLDVHRPIDRCPTPGVNPQTGERDIKVTPGMQEHIGHIYCGMYARIVAGGTLEEHMPVTVVGNGGIALEETMVSNASAYALWPRVVTVASCDIGEHATTLALQASGPWPLPKAQAGQKMRLHLGIPGWTTEFISHADSDQITLAIEDSQTGDPITALLRKGFPVGRDLIVSGPFGRVR